MARVILINLILLVLPLALYWAYAKATGRRDASGDVEVDPMPIVSLIGVGALLMLGAILWQIDYDGAPKEGRYVPPTYKDGKIIPGHIEPEKK